MKLVIANSYPTRAHGIIVNYWMKLSRIWRILQIKEDTLLDLQNSSYPTQPLRPSASVDNTLRDLQNSSYPMKAEFNNCFIIHSKYFLPRSFPITLFVFPLAKYNTTLSPGFLGQRFNNLRRNNNVNYYSFKIFPRFWLVKTTRIIHHDQLLFTKFGKNLRHIESMTSKVERIENYWTNDVKSAARPHSIIANYWTSVLHALREGFLLIYPFVQTFIVLHYFLFRLWWLTWNKTKTQAATLRECHCTTSAILHISVVEFDVWRHEFANLSLPCEGHLRVCQFQRQYSYQTILIKQECKPAGMNSREICRETKVFFSLFQSQISLQS